MAIHEQNYVSYQGPLDDSGGWKVFARTTFRLAWSFTRTKLLLFALWIPVIISLGLVFVEYGLREKLPMNMGNDAAPSVTVVTAFLQMQFFSAALLMMASGCNAIADDLKYRTFQIFFSRPVERWEYILGKWLGLFGLCSLVTIVPAVLVGGLRAAYFSRTDIASAVYEQTLAGLGISVLIAVVVASIVLGLSSITRRTSYAVLAWIGVLVVPLIVTGIVATASEGSSSAQLWNLVGNIYLVTQSLMAAEAPDVPIWAPLLILVGASALSIYGVRLRVDKLEGIA